jgi:adenylate cyclase
VRATSPLIVEEAHLRVFDAYQRLRPRVYQPQPVAIIDIDNESLEKIGQWPWPRTYLADLLVRAFDAGAATVAFDIVFAEPDRTSPANVLPVWPATPEIDELREMADKLPDHDALFADVIRQAPVVTGFVPSDQAGANQPAVKWGMATAGDDPLLFLKPYAGAVINLPAIEKAAKGNGSFAIEPDRDNIIRRVNMLFSYGGKIYPSLSAEALRVAQGASTYIVKSSGANQEQAFGEKTGINHVKIGRFEVPTDAGGSLWIHFTGHRPERYVPAWELFEDDFDKSRIEGRILLVGTSAPGLGDLRATPLNASVPGVEVHVEAIEQILSGHFLERPDWADGAEIVYLVVLGLVLIVLLPKLGALLCAGLGVAGVATAVGSSWYLFTDRLWLLDPVMPSLAVIVIYIVSSLFNYLHTEAERRQVRGAFAQYLSPALVKQLAADPSKLRLGGETREMTFLFCDVRGFTAVSEQFKSDPQGLTTLINRFLTPMTDTILARGGTIDKYMGDCIMAFWNAPLDDEAHADHACDSALTMFVELDKLNERLKTEAVELNKPFTPLNVGIGLNTGHCVVGNMGSDQRFDYSVLGDAVNLASRLEGQSKTYGVGIVIGDETRARANGYATLELDLIAVKGRREAERIHALVGREDKRRDEGFKDLVSRHLDMLAAYRNQDWRQARQLIAECRALDGEFAPLYDLYRERIENYEREPPPPDWDGVFVATTK